jgi:hypothetical protein
MPSLALLLELSDLATGSSGGFGGFLAPPYIVSYENTCRSLQWCRYLESHARRVYSVGGPPEEWAAKQLARKITSRAIGTEFFSCREIAHKDWKGLTSAELVKNACLLLERAHWLRNVTEQPTESGGRPSLRYQINPKVHDMTTRED